MSDRSLDPVLPVLQRMVTAVVEVQAAFRRLDAALRANTAAWQDSNLPELIRQAHRAWAHEVKHAGKPRTRKRVRRGR